MFVNDRSYKDFIKHNISLFKKKKIKKKTCFLLEFNGWQSVQIANSYLINTIPFIRNSKVIAFDSHRLLLNKKFSIVDNIKWLIGSKLKIKNFGTYSSFGVDNFILTEISDESKKIKAKKITQNFFKNNKSKESVENFILNDVWIGDLIYDTYLKKYNTPTIDLSDINFVIFFEECVKNFLFWDDYFKNNHVSGLAVCHAVYTHGIPVRIAVKKKIPIFAVSDSKIFKIDQKTCSFKMKTTGVEYQHNNFRKIFKTFSTNEKKNFLLEGKKFLESIINEKKHYFYFQKKNSKITKQYFKKKNKSKMVIFAHSFFDSPHLRGNSLFPDFYEWLNFLATISKKSKLDWYIKPHPNYEDDNKYIIDEFVKKNPNIKKIDPKASNKDLVKQGMRYALTIYGSCASELPFLGVKVINADPKNPHSKYNFSLNPKNRKHLEQNILNIKNEKIKINKKELYEYHFMNQIYYHNNYLFRDLEKLHKKIDGRQFIYSSDILNYWIKKFSIQKHLDLKKSILEFYKDSSHFLCLKHMKKSNL